MPRNALYHLLFSINSAGLQSLSRPLGGSQAAGPMVRWIGEFFSPWCRKHGPEVISNCKLLSFYLSYKGRRFSPIYVWKQYIRKLLLQGTSLVAWWLRIRLPMQGTRVRALVREDPTCRRANKPMRHNYWACALEPVSHNYWARVPQLLKPTCLEPMLHNKRSHRNEKPTHHNTE